MSTEAREFWIEQDDNGLLSVYRFHPGHAHQLFHVIEIQAYQSLQEKYDKLSEENERLKLALLTITKGCPTKAKGCTCLENTAVIALQALSGEMDGE